MLIFCGPHLVLDHLVEWHGTDTPLKGECLQLLNGTVNMLCSDKFNSSSLPDHSHSSQETAIAVLTVKNTIKKRAAETDMPTKEIVADSLRSLDFEEINKLNC